MFVHSSKRLTLINKIFENCIKRRKRFLCKYIISTDSNKILYTAKKELFRTIIQLSFYSQLCFLNKKKTSILCEFFFLK